MNALEYLYLDYAASTPVLEEAIEEMMPFYTSYCGNASNSINAMGDYLSKAIRCSKDNILGLLNAHDYEVVFNSGATEGINTCIRSLYKLYGASKKQIITCRTEHKAVIQVCEQLELIGAQIHYLSVNADGAINTDELNEVINQDTLAVVLMAVNNETGVIHDVQEVSEICLRNSVRFICDATQAVGKMKIDLSQTNIDYLILSGHKMYAPKGIGALLYRKAEKVAPIIYGGGQQNNIRSGTLNVPGIVGLGKSSEILREKIKEEYTRVRALQKKFEDELSNFGNISVIAKDGNRSPFISNICFEGQEVEDILFPTRNYMSFSTGSACTSQIIEPSYVLKEMGLDNKKADKCLRFSFGLQTTHKTIEQALLRLKPLL